MLGYVIHDRRVDPSCRYRCLLLPASLRIRPNKVFQATNAALLPSRLYMPQTGAEVNYSQSEQASWLLHSNLDANATILATTKHLEGMTGRSSLL